MRPGLEAAPKMRTIFKQKQTLSFVFCGFFLTSCNAAQDKSDAVAVVPEAPTVTWTEIPEDAIAFIRMHPKAAQKNTYATWKHYRSDDGKTAWRLKNQDISTNAVQALDALVDAIGTENDLIPADGFYACRYQENMPEYRVEFQRNQKKYQIVSMSNCLNAAPFNVIIDGKPFIQISGAFGSALQKVLTESGVQLKVGETAAMIMFDKNSGVIPEGFSLLGGTPQIGRAHV